MATDPVEIASDLQFLFDREGVPVEIGKKLAEFGITTVAKFSALVKDQEDLREMLKKDFALDGETGGAEGAIYHRLDFGGLVQREATR